MSRLGGDWTAELEYSVAALVLGVHRARRCINCPPAGPRDCEVRQWAWETYRKYAMVAILLGGARPLIRAGDVRAALVRSRRDAVARSSE